jgi:predicted membrane-bound mannosyltransferase
VGQDEVMLNDPGRELARSGVLRTTVFGSRFDFDKVYLFQPFGQALTIAAVYKVFGFGLLQTRLPGVIVAGLCVWLMYFWVYRASQSSIGGFVAALLLSLNPGFMLTSRLGRMDVFCILLLLGGLVCITDFCMAAGLAIDYGYLALAGFLMGAAVLMHLIALEFLAGTAALHTDSKRTHMEPKTSVCFRVRRHLGRSISSLVVVRAASWQQYFRRATDKDGLEQVGGGHRTVT